MLNGPSVGLGDFHSLLKGHGELTGFVVFNFVFKCTLLQRFSCRPVEYVEILTIQARIQIQNKQVSLSNAKGSQIGSLF